MSLSRFLLILATCTLASFLALLFIVLRMSPYADGLLAVILFYLTLMFSVFGMIFFLTFAGLNVFKKEALPTRQIGLSVKISLHLTLFILLMLILQSERVLFVWDFILLVLIFISFPIFLKAKNKHL